MKRARYPKRPPSQPFSSCDKQGVTFTFPLVPSEELILTSQKGDGGELPCRNVDLVLQALVFKRSQKPRFFFFYVQSPYFQMLATRMYFLREYCLSQTKHVQAEGSPWATVS